MGFAPFIFERSDMSSAARFNNPGAQNFGTTPTLSATSTSGLSVTFTSTTTGICSITSGGALTFVAAGVCTITADQAGSPAYVAASPVTQSFAINAVVTNAPTIGLATAGDAQASVAFTAPISNGGSAITGYTVTSSPGSLTGTGASSPIAVTGLTNGTAYTFTVTATNAAGTGLASVASNAVTPIGLQTISFANPGTQNFGTTPTLTATATSGLGVAFTSSTPGVCTITSGGLLTFVTVGSCTINANQAGTGSYLAAAQVSRSFSVGASVASAPTGVSATGGNALATVSFTAPVATGGAPITLYTATSSPGGITGSGPTSPIAITGLANGTAYTFTVTATNSAGIGAASSPSNSVTPTAQVASNTVVTLSNAAPTYGTNVVLTATVSPTGTGTVTFFDGAVNLGVAPLNSGVASLAISSLSVGSHNITAVYAGDAGRFGSTSSVSTVNVSRGTTSVALIASTTAPAFGQNVTFTATVTPSVATGSVAFKDGSTTISTVTLAGGTATVSTSALSAGGHSVTAVYSGDATYATSTSAAVVVTPIRPDPTGDKNVRGILSQQAAMTQRVAGTQIDTVQRRLETLHEDETPAFVNGISLSTASGLPANANALADPMKQAEHVSRSPTRTALDRNALRNAPRNAEFGKLQVTSPVHVWTAGSVIFGATNVAAIGATNPTRTHFALSGLTVGIDTKLFEGVKGGFSTSYSSETADINTDGSRATGRAVTGSLYGSWRLADKIFLDGLMGYGGMSFDSKRLDGNAASFISGERTGRMVFGSLAVSYDQTTGALKFAPYLRLDLIEATLGAYAENGDASWTLAFQKAQMASRSAVAGLRGQYDIAQPWGTLSPTVRVEYRRMLSGTIMQTMNYASDTSTSYALTMTGAARDMYSTALGVQARGDGAVMGSLEYLLSGSREGVQGQGLRGALRVGF